VGDTQSPVSWDQNQQGNIEGYLVDDKGELDKL
jgi:hypothetical protein